MTRPNRASVDASRTSAGMIMVILDAELATALLLAVEGRITARGRLASAIQPPRHQHVYQGDRPSPHQNAWQEAVAQAEAVKDTARTDRDTARQLLAC